jgi:hypothetical protein
MRRAASYGVVWLLFTIQSGDLAQAQAPARRPAAPAVAGYTGPRTPDGKPDLNGIWQVFGTADRDIEPHVAQDGVPAGLGIVVGDEIPYQPAAREQQKKNYQNRAAEDPLARCFLPGVPRVMYLPFPFEIVQTPKHIGMAFEYAHATRTIFLDGTPHLEDLDFWMGDSRGKWEKDALIVNTVSLNGRTWLDHAGNFHTSSAKMTERFTPVGPYHMDYEVTIDDPKVFTKPLQLKMTMYRRVEKNLELLDYECVEHFYLKLFDEHRR